MRKLAAILALAFLLQGCGTKVFHPPVYPLAENKIATFSVNGQVALKNRQDATASVILHSYGGAKLTSNYQQVTDTMVTQAITELERHGHQEAGGNPKTIGLKVTHLRSKYIAFFWKSEMRFTVALGDDEPFEMTVNHGTGAGVGQNLSGSIADGVVALFSDSRVLDYLKE